MDGAVRVHIVLQKSTDVYQEWDPDFVKIANM